MAETAPTDAEAQDGYNPTSSGGFDATDSDFSHDYQSRQKGIDHVNEHKSFDPKKVGLPEDFNLFSFARLRGSGAKAPRPELLALLKDVGQTDVIGSDVAIVKSNLYDYFLVSTIDYFYSPVEDPYMTGWIAAANMASDIFAVGLQYVDNVLMSLAASSEMPEKERFICTKLMMLGFDHCVKSIPSVVTGGQSIMNPWPLIGGIAKTMCKEEDLIRPWNGVAGDVIVITKPLGTTQCVDARAWSKGGEKQEEINALLSSAQIDRGYRVAEASMARLNINAARLMHEFDAHGATDISGYGPVGEAEKLVEQQKADVDFVLHTLPVIKEALIVDGKIPPHNLRSGRCAETSGGLFVLLAADSAQGFCDKLKEADGWDAYIVGDVVAGNHKSRIVDDPKIIEV